MKIGIITNLYPPFARGGAETVIVRTVGELLALGHDVFVVTGQPKKEGKGIILDRSSTERIYRFFPKNLYFTLDDFRYPWLVRLPWHVIDAFSGHGAKVVETVLAKEQPDVVITHNLKGLGLNIPKAIRAANVPHLHIIHDLQLVIPSGLMMFGKEETPWFTKPFYAIYRLICRKKIGQPDLVISPSKYLDKMYSEAGFFKKTRVEVVPNPAPRYVSNVKPAHRVGPFKLLFAGQLGQHKGLLFLLDILNNKELDIQLLIAGDGPLRSVVEGRVSNDRRITYLGYTQADELVKVFSVVDALVVPSLCYENSPTVIYEALHAGLPILASRIGGVGELVEEGKNGFLFTPGNAPDFNRALAALIARRDEFAQKSEEIKQTVSNYSLDKYALGLIERCKMAVERHEAERQKIKVSEK